MKKSKKTWETFTQILIINYKNPNYCLLGKLLFPIINNKVNNFKFNKQDTTSFHKCPTQHTVADLINKITLELTNEL